jgi:hypothetical protein
VEDPQPGLRLLTPYRVEGVQQRDEVLGRVRPADPRHRRVRVRGLLVGLGRRLRGRTGPGEPAGVDPGVDRPHPLPGRTAPLLPAPHMRGSGRDQRGLPVGLAGQQPEVVAEQGADGRGQPGGPVGEQRLPGTDGVLGDDQRGAAEPFAQQPRQGRGAAGHRVAHIGRPQLVGAVPGGRQRAQLALQQIGGGEEFGDDDVAEHRAYAGRAAGRLQLRDRVVAAQHRREGARGLHREVREGVQAGGETVRPLGRAHRRTAGQGGGQVPEAAAEGRAPGLGGGAADAAGCDRSGLAPEALVAHVAHLRRGLDPARGLRPRGAAQGVDVEVVVGQAPDEAVAPCATLTSCVRITTLGK